MTGVTPPFGCPPLCSLWGGGGGVVVRDGRAEIDTASSTTTPVGPQVPLLPVPPPHLSLNSWFCSFSYGSSRLSRTDPEQTQNPR